MACGDYKTFYYGLGYVIKYQRLKDYTNKYYYQNSNSPFAVTNHLLKSYIYIYMILPAHDNEAIVDILGNVNSLIFLQYYKLSAFIFTISKVSKQKDKFQKSM